SGTGMKIHRLLFILGFGIFFLSTTVSAQNQDFCGLKNTSFQEGEQISYIVYYNVAGIYVNAGSAVFTSALERMNNRMVYHVVGEGKTNPSYDWIFKVRDKYESFIDTAGMEPLKFLRNIDEGGYKKYENVTFNSSANTAVTTKGVYKVPDCIQDVLSAVYYARNIDFNKYQVNDKIPFKM